MEVQLHVDVRMCQKAGTQTTKIKSAKSFVEVHPRKFIPSKYTRYTVIRGNIIMVGSNRKSQLGNEDCKNRAVADLHQLSIPK